MPYTSLRAFVRDLEARGQLVRVRAEVDAHLEAGAIAIRCLREGGPALLFENVRGAQHPLLLNLFGTMDRITLALGLSPAELGQRLHGAAESMMPPSPSRALRGAWGARGLAPRVLSMRTTRAWHAPVQEVSETPNLDRLPILTCWPADGGRFLTYPNVLTQSPSTGGLNMGVYRMQVFAPDLTGMHWQIERGSGAHYSEAEALGRPLPVAVAIGSDPATLISAIAPLPEGMDELRFSGFLRGAPLAVARSGAGGIPVPANAEFVLEGEVAPFERRVEGPFGDHFGHYSAASPFPLFRIQRVTRRRDAIYHGVIVGKPPQEDQPLGDAVQEVTAPMLSLIHPEVRGVWAYYEAGFHNLLGVQVHERYGREGLKAAFGLLGQGQLSLSKVVVLTGPEHDPRDPHALLRALAKHFRPEEDAHILSETALDTLDFTSYRMHRGSKMILDAIPRADAPPRPPMSAEARAACDAGRIRSLDARIGRVRLVDDALLVVTVPMGTVGRPVLETLLAALPADTVPLLAVVSDDVDIDSHVELIWGITTRFDAALDVRFSQVETVGAVAVPRGILGIDASWKPGYQEPLVTDPATDSLLDRRWKEYFAS